jgi:PIN domain nuclease of toxin-antitoxin system
VTRGLLLDTCAIIWIALDQMIAKDARRALNAEFAAGARVRVSVISAWELGLLSAKGRLPTTVPALSLFNELLGTPGVKLEALSPELLIES